MSTLIPNSVKQMFMGFRVDQHFETCKATAKQSFQELPPEDYEILDEILRNIPEIVAEFQKYAREVAARITTIDAEGATVMMREATAFLKKKKTKDVVDDFIARYGSMAADDRIMVAVGSYLRCVLSHIDDRYKEAAMAAVEMVVALIGLVSGDNKIREFTNSVGASLQSNVIKPAMMEIRNGATNAKTNANGNVNVRANVGRVPPPNARKANGNANANANKMSPPSPMASMATGGSSNKQQKSRGGKPTSPTSPHKSAHQRSHKAGSGAMSRESKKKNGGNSNKSYQSPKPASRHSSRR